MLHHVKTLPPKWLRRATGAAFTLLIVALTLFSGRAAFAEPRRQVTPQLLVEFRLTLTPDKEAERAGAVAFSNQVGMTGGVWVDQFTGFGCVSGPFEPSMIDLRSWSEGDAHSFEVTCRSRSDNDVQSRIDWKGKLE